MKRMNRKLIVLTIALLFAGLFQLKAQFDGMFTQYMFNEMFINPAYAGSKEAMSATLLHRQQWVSFPGRPITSSFSFHGPIVNGKMGLGISFLNEKVGALNRNLLYGSYAYRLKTSETGTLALGLMGGLDNQVNRFDQIKVTDVVGGAVDPNFSTNSMNLIGGNFGTGLYYSTKNYYAGLSIPRMLDNQVKQTWNASRTYMITSLDPKLFTYYFTAGGVYKVNEDLRLKGTAMLKMVKNAPLSLDVTASALIKETLWVGLAYRSNSALSLILGAQVNKQLLVSYSYDYGLNSIQKYSNGSHEIGLNYLFSYKSYKAITPRYF